MKKVLILAYDFPPYVSVGGLRPNYWYENFKEMGLFPIVITRNWNPIHGNALDYIQPSKTKEIEIEETGKGILIKTPYKATLSNRLTLKGKKDPISNLLKKISTGWNEIGQWFLPIGTKYELYKAAKNFLKDNKVDIILATGDPFILFKYASKLSKKFNIPWVADYRDLWSNDITMNYKPIQKKVAQVLEKKYIKNVTFVSTVSEVLERIIQLRFPNKKIITIANGYNESYFKNISKLVAKNDALTISLAGSLYNWHPYRVFLESIDEYISLKKKNLKIVFYGINKNEEIKDIVENSVNLKEVVQIYPKLPYEQVLDALSKANLFLLFNEHSNIGVGTKIYDYIALNRKVLFCFEENTQSSVFGKNFNEEITSHFKNNLIIDLLTNTNSGIIVKNGIHLHQVLDILLNEFETKGYIDSNIKNIENYSRKIQTEKLVNFINEIYLY